MLIVGLALALAGCGLTGNTRLVSQPFPEPTADQVEALISCRMERPVLDEWWVRFDRAWEAATN